MKAPRLLGVAAAVAALHLALLQRWAPPLRPAANPAARLTVVTLAPRPAQPPAAGAQPMATARPAADAAPSRAALPSRRAPATASAASAGPQAQDAAIAAAPAASTTPALPAPPRPLDLALHPAAAGSASSRNPALDDPRATTARATPEARMAQRFSQAVHEELHEDGSVRIRRGDDCVDVRESRAAQLFAGDGSTRPQPRLVSACP